MILIPTWLALPPDDEGLFIEVAPTVFQSRELFDGNYPLWNPWIGFGVPHPLSPTLVFHPFMLLVAVLPLGLAIGALYQLQLWVGLLSVWGIARHLGLGRVPTAICVITYGLSSPTLNYLNDFWPSVLLQWTLAPLVLLLLLKLFDSERIWQRAALATALGACAGLMVLDGHAGVMPLFAAGFAAFLAGAYRRTVARWPWVAAAVSIAVLAAASRVYDISLEVSHSTGERLQQDYPMDFWRLFFYPIDSPLRDDYYRLLALGGPVVLLAAIGLVYRLAHPHSAAFRAAACVSFALWFIPIGAISILSTNYIAGNVFIVFAVPLAGLTFQALWQRMPMARPLLALAAGVQVTALVVGFEPFYSRQFTRALDVLRGERVEALKPVLMEQPMHAVLARQPDIDGTRTYMTPGAEERLYRTEFDYTFAGWWLQNLRLVNGEFRGTEINELVVSDTALHATIKAEPTLQASQPALNVLNIGYLLATPGEAVAPSLERLRSVRLDDATIVVYRNPSAWPDAVVLQPAAKRLHRVAPRPGCERSGLLCAEFEPVTRLRVAGAERRQRWRDTELEVELAPSSEDRVLMISQLFRPGWEAELDGGRTVGGYRILGGFTGFDVSPDTRLVRIGFRPADRVALTALTWATLFCALGAIGVFLVADSRRSRPGGQTASARHAA